MRRLLGVVTVLSLLGGCGYLWLQSAFPPPEIVGVDVLEPLPAPLAILYEDTSDCRGSGENGFRFRNLVVGPSAPDETGAVAAHLRELGFEVSSEPPSDRLEWARMVVERGSVRATVGDARAYAGDPSFLFGPSLSGMEDALASSDDEYTLLVLEPIDVACEI
jgi:hypothetical protein